MFMYLKFDLSLYKMSCTLCYHHFKYTWSTFSLSIDVHAQNIGNQTYLLRKSRESFDTGIVKKFRRFEYLAKKTVFLKKNVYSTAIEKLLYCLVDDAEDSPHC